MTIPDTVDLVLICLVNFVASHIGVLAILASIAFICIWRLHIRRRTMVCPSSCMGDYSPVYLIKRCIGYLSRHELLEVDNLRNNLLQQAAENQGSTERSNDRVPQSVRNPDIPVIASNLSDSLTPHRVPEPEPSYPVSWREAQASVPDVCIKQDDSSEKKDPEMRESESETFEGAQSLKLPSKTEPERPGTVDGYTPDTINSNPESQLLQLKNEIQQTRDCEVMSSDSVMKQSTSHELDVHQAEMPEANRHDDEKEERQCTDGLYTMNSRNHESGHHGKNEVTKHLHLTHDETDVSLSPTVSFHTYDEVTLSDCSDIDSDDSEIFVTREDPVAAIKQPLFQENNGFPEHSLACDSDEKSLERQSDKRTEDELETEDSAGRSKPAEFGTSSQQSKTLKRKETVEKENSLATAMSQENSLAAEMPQANSMATSIFQENSRATKKENTLAVGISQDNYLTTEMPQEKTLATGMSQENSPATEIHREKSRATAMSQENSLAAETSQENSPATSICQGNSPATEIFWEKSRATAMSQENSLADEMSQENSLATSICQGNSPATEIPQEKSWATAMSQENSLADEMSQENSLATSICQGNSPATEIPQAKSWATAMSQENSLADEMSQENSLATGMSQENSPATEIHREKSRATVMSQENSLADEMSQENSQATSICQGNSPATEIPREKSRATAMSQENSLADEMSQENSLVTSICQGNSPATEIPREKSRATAMSQENSLADEMSQENSLATSICQGNSPATEIPLEKSRATAMSQENSLAAEMSQENPPATSISQGNSRATEKGKTLAAGISQDTYVAAEMPQEKTQATGMSQENSLATEISQENFLASSISQEKSRAPEKEINLAVGISQDNYLTKTLGTDMSQENSQATEIPRENSLATGMSQENSLAAEMSQENSLATSISQENSWATLWHGHSINTADEHMQADSAQHDNGRAEEMKAMDVQKKQVPTPQAQCGGGKTGKGVQMMEEVNSRDDEVPRPEADTSDKADKQKEDDVDDGKDIIRNTKKDSHTRCENEQTTHP